VWHWCHIDIQCSQISTEGSEKPHEESLEDAGSGRFCDWGLALGSSPSNAGFTVTLTSGVNPAAVITDNSAGPPADLNPATNAILSVLSYAGYNITLSSSTNTPGVGGMAQQTANTITVANVSGTTPLKIDVQATGYTLGSSTGLLTNSESTSLLSGSSSAAAFSTVNGGQPSPTVTLTGPTVSASGITTEGVALTPTFTLDSIMTLSNLAVGGTDNITWTTSVVAPAPTDLMLLLSSSPALGLGYWLRRRTLRAKAV